jgi:hypothetical protein
MKRNLFILIGSILFLIPSISNAQMMVGPPMDPGPSASGLGMMFQPRRVGFVHEISVTASKLTGVAGEDFVAGAGMYYSGLFRTTPQFAWGLHAGISGSTHIDGYGETVHSMAGLEGRFYIPVGLIDLWVSGVVGVGSLTETWDTGTDGYSEEGETHTGALLGLGVGASYYISPSLSVGGYIRVYRQTFDDDKVITLDGNEEMTPSEYYGNWLSVGGFVALHY